MSFIPEETEATITLRVSFATIKIEALRYCCFHLRDGTGCIRVYVCAYTMASMHDERSFIHSSLRCLDEVQVMCPTCPCSVYVRIRMKDRFEILPFTSVATSQD